MIAQPLKISGKVIGEDLVELPMVNIYDTDTTLITTSSLDGTFELTLEANELLFGYLGMEWEKIPVSESCSKLEVILLLAGTYHYNSHRKIDRIRKERFDKRDEIHRKALEQGIFKNNTPCFQYEFNPNKPDLDEIRDWMKEKKIEIREEFNRLTIGDTIQVPYSGPRTSSVHTSYSDYTNYDCLITGTVLKKDKKKRGLNIQFRVINMNNCNYEPLTHKEQVVNIGDTIEHNMKYFRVITASNIGYE